jgi:hypothetical protein
MCGKTRSVEVQLILSAAVKTGIVVQSALLPTSIIRRIHVTIQRKKVKQAKKNA